MCVILGGGSPWIVKAPTKRGVESQGMRMSGGLILHVALSHPLGESTGLEP